jgi:hypothetical protein
MLFCAIANGVIAYLAANAGDLQVVLDDPGITGHVQLQWGGD